MVDPHWGLLAFISILFVVAFLPGRGQPLKAVIFDPLIYVFMALLLGTVGKLIWLALVERPESQLRPGFPYIDSITEALIYVGCCLVMLIGIYRLLPRVADQRLKLDALLSIQLSRLVFFVGGLVSFVAFFLMWDGLGWGALLTDLSAKRFNDMDGGAGRMQSGIYWFYQLSLFVKYPLYLYFVSLVAGERRIGWTDACLAGFGVFFVIFQNFALSQRAFLLMFCFDLMLLYLMFSERNLTQQLKKLAPWVIAVVIAVLVVTVSRSDAAASKSFADHFVSSKYFMDVAKTAEIMAYADEGGNESACALYGWVFLFTPTIGIESKSCFLYIGKLVGYEVYGQEVSGVPPGFFGEMYLYAGFLGGLVAAAALALLLWLARLLLLNSGSILCRMIYVLVLTRILFLLFNNGFGAFMVRVLYESVLLMIVALIAQVLYWILPKRDQASENEDHGAVRNCDHG